MCHERLVNNAPNMRRAPLSIRRLLQCVGLMQQCVVLTLLILMAMSE